MSTIRRRATIQTEGDYWHNGLSSSSQSNKESDWLSSLRRSVKNRRGRSKKSSRVFGGLKRRLRGGGSKRKAQSATQEFIERSRVPVEVIEKFCKLMTSDLDMLEKEWLLFNDFNVDSGRTAELIRFLSSEEECEITTGYSLCEVSVAMRNFLQNMPTPLLPFTACDELMIVADITDDVTRLSELQKLFSSLPADAKQGFRQLAECLTTILKSGGKHGLSAYELSVAIAPAIIWPREVDQNIIFINMKRCRMLEDYIDYYDYIFMNAPLVLKHTTAIDRESIISDSSLDALSLSGEMKVAEEMDREVREEVLTQHGKEDGTILSDEDVYVFLEHDVTDGTDGEEPQRLGRHTFEKYKVNAFSPVQCDACRNFVFRKAICCRDCQRVIHKACEGRMLGCSGEPPSNTSAKRVQVGDRAPLFTLLAGAREVSLEAILRSGKKVVLFFYPKDFTPGCTRENKLFAKHHLLFRYANCELIGISADALTCHEKFAEKHKLPFTLLSDPLNRVRTMYGVPSNMGGLQPGRVTYVINPKGMVTHMYNSYMNTYEHVIQSLFAVTRMLAEDPAFDGIQFTSPPDRDPPSSPRDVHSIATSGGDHSLLHSRRATTSEACYNESNIVDSAGSLFTLQDGDGGDGAGHTLLDMTMPHIADDSDYDSGCYGSDDVHLDSPLPLDKLRSIPSNLGDKHPLAHQHGTASPLDDEDEDGHPTPTTMTMLDDPLLKPSPGPASTHVQTSSSPPPRPPRVDAPVVCSTRPSASWSGALEAEVAWLRCRMMAHAHTPSTAPSIDPRYPRVSALVDDARIRWTSYHGVGRPQYRVKIPCGAPSPLSTIVM